MILQITAEKKGVSEETLSLLWWGQCRHSNVGVSREVYRHETGGSPTETTADTSCIQYANLKKKTP